MKEKSVVKLGVMIAGVMCVAACSGVPEPIVDKTGVNEGQYSRDLADCYRNMPFIAAGNPVAACMRQKRYTVLYDR